MLGPYLVNLAKLMGLEDAVASHLDLHRRERSDGFTAMQMLWVLAEAILYGIDRVDNISVLGTDALRIPPTNDSLGFGLNRPDPPRRTLDCRPRRG